MGPKISTVEIVFITPLFLINDIIGIILILAGLDDIFILDIIRILPSQAYLWFKGLRGTYMMTANIIEIIPYVGALPAATVGWLATVWLDRHPESAVTKTVQTVARAIPASKGGKGIAAPSAKPIASMPKNISAPTLQKTTLRDMKKVA